MNHKPRVAASTPRPWALVMMPFGQKIRYRKVAQLLQEMDESSKQASTSP